MRRHGLRDFSDALLEREKNLGGHGIVCEEAAYIAQNSFLLRSFFFVNFYYLLAPLE